MKNQTYDALKYIALQVIPALEVFLIAIGEIWNIGIMGKIAATVAAFGVFLGALLIKKSKEYKSDTDQQTTVNEDGLAMFDEEENDDEDQDDAAIE